MKSDTGGGRGGLFIWKSPDHPRPRRLMFQTLWAVLVGLVATNAAAVPLLSPTMSRRETTSSMQQLLHEEATMHISSNNSDLHDISSNDGSGRAMYRPEWTYDVYGLCNFMTDAGATMYEYDGTHLAAAPAYDAKSGKPGYGQVSSAGGYHHIFQCDEAKCLAKNNIRVYNSKLFSGNHHPLHGLLAVFWTNEKKGYKISSGCRDFSFVGNNCWSDGSKPEHQFSSGQKHYVVVVSACGAVTFHHGENRNGCPAVSPGGCPPPPPPPPPVILNVTGQWVPIYDSSGAQEYELIQGTRHQTTNISSHTWGSTVTKVVQTGFEFLGIGGVSTKVTGTTSHDFGTENEQLFSTDSTTTWTSKFGPGTVWQWQWTIYSRVGKDLARSSTFTQDSKLTKGRWDPPCCLPGLSRLSSSTAKTPIEECVSEDPEDPKGGVYDLCNGNVTANSPPKAPTARHDTVVGSWVPHHSSNAAKQSYTYEQTIRHSHKLTNRERTSWQKSVTEQANVGITYEGFGVQHSESLTSTVSQSFGMIYSSMFEEYTTQKSTYEFGPGTIWEWQWAATVNYGSQGDNSTVMTGAFVLTPSKAEPPCCLPGFSKNASLPHKGCAAAPHRSTQQPNRVYDLCGPGQFRSGIQIPEDRQRREDAVEGTKPKVDVDAGQ
jgi:hypothetical protein